MSVTPGGLIGFRRVLLLGLLPGLGGAAVLDPEPPPPPPPGSNAGNVPILGTPSTGSGAALFCVIATGNTPTAEQPSGLYSTDTQGGYTKECGVVEIYRDGVLIKKNRTRFGPGGYFTETVLAPPAWLLSVTFLGPSIAEWDGAGFSVAAGFDEVAPATYEIRGSYSPDPSTQTIKHRSTAFSSQAIGSVPRGPAVGAQHRLTSAYWSNTADFSLLSAPFWRLYRITDTATVGGLSTPSPDFATQVATTNAPAGYSFARTEISAGKRYFDIGTPTDPAAAPDGLYLLEYVQYPYPATLGGYYERLYFRIGGSQEPPPPPEPPSKCYRPRRRPTGQTWRRRAHDCECE